MNGSPASRRSSSPPPSLTPQRLVTELTPALDSLRAICDQQHVDLDAVLPSTEHILRLRHTLIDSDDPREAKDAFRILGGFQTLLDVVRQLAHLYVPKSQSKEHKKSLLLLFKDVLAVIAECLKGHPGNRRFFAKKVEGGGSESIEESLNILLRKLDVGDTESNDAEQLYGGVLAAALSEETVYDIFSVLGARYASDTGSLESSTIRTAVEQLLGPEETIELHEFLSLLMRTWLAHSSRYNSYTVLRLAIPAALCHLSSLSQKNLVALHATGILSLILSAIFNEDRSEQEKSLYQELAVLLSRDGVNNLDDAVILYRRAFDNPMVSHFLLNALRASKGPPCVHFDMSTYGYSSIELSTLGRPFPPLSSAGYSLSVWARFDRFDPQSHTTIFGAFDASQTCFVLAYLEKDTRHFILQTSMNGSRPSVRFKSAVFEPNRWYHICVIHRRSRATTSSRASLFVNGEFVEQLKIEYPNTPLAISSNKPPRVQAFLGTPQDLAVKLGKGMSTSRWSLASAILFEEAFSDDLIAVFYHLGPRYHGNFQDCLGSFQTYKASAALNLRNENLHPGREERSDIVTAIRQKASNLVHERSILLNISATTILDDDDDNYIDETQLVKSLSRQAAKNLHQMTKSAGNAIAINGAIPAINDALTYSHGVAILTGDPVVSVPQSLDDASWRIGGCAAVHLNMLQAATNPESTVLAVEILFEAVQDSWRNSEAMERENGYGILALLLREKLGFPQVNQSAVSRTSTVCSDNRERSVLAIDLLRLILSFVGYDFEYPNKSIITNPLAYRVLLVDLEIWRFGEPSLLQMYYSQFTTFATESQHRRFNAKRLSRMRKINAAALLTARKTNICIFRCQQEAFRCLERRRILGTVADLLHSSFSVSFRKLSIRGTASLACVIHHLRAPRKQVSETQ